MVRLDPLAEDMERTPPQTEDAQERGFTTAEEAENAEQARGESSSVDPDQTGDIADEGSAHRG